MEEKEGVWIGMGKEGRKEKEGRKNKNLRSRG